jgi:hypothetical protein
MTKVLGLDTLPLEVVTTMGPLVAPDGTTTTIRPDVFFFTTAGVPLNVTSLASVSFFPKMATRDPAAAARGITRMILRDWPAPW